MPRQRLDIRDWEAFATLVRLRHFGHAADELGITQSAISQRLAKLEADLQIKLLVRTNKGVEPTEEGAALLPEARSLIAAKHKALEVAAAIREKGARPLRLALSNAIVHTALLPRLRSVIANEFDVEFLVDVVSADEIEARLVTGECDLAVTTLPLARASIEERELSKLPMAVAVPEETPIDIVSIDELCRHPLLMVPRDTEPGLFDALISAATHSGLTLNIGQLIVSFPSILAMVLMGKGWGIVPLSMADGHPLGLKILPLDLTEPPFIRVLLAWKQQNAWAGQLAELLGTSNSEPVDRVRQSTP